jgi:hypothetical protein
MTIRRRGAWHTEAVVSAIYWDFQPGQRVMTVDKIPGTVVAVQDGAFPGQETYDVVLDNNLGGGSYGAGDLSDMSQRTAAEVVGTGIHLAVEDYPELGTILADRPDPGKLSFTAAANGPWYHGTRHELTEGDVMEGGKFPSNQGDAQPGQHVYYTGRPDVAHDFAEAGYGPEHDPDAEPKVYQVEPVHGHEADPDEDGGFQSYRAPSVRVIRRHAAAEPPTPEEPGPVADQPATGLPEDDDQPSACSYCGGTDFEGHADNGRVQQATCSTCGGTMSAHPGAQWTPELIGDPSNHPSVAVDPASGASNGGGQTGINDFIDFTSRVSTTAAAEPEDDTRTTPTKRAGFAGYVEAEKTNFANHGDNPDWDDEQAVGAHAGVHEFRGYSGRENNFAHWHDKGEITHVPLHGGNIYATQPRVTNRGVNAYLNDPQRKPGSGRANYPANDRPIFVHHGGNYYTLDGHHRTAAAMLRGDEHVEGHVYDADKHGFPEPEWSPISEHLPRSLEKYSALAGAYLGCGFDTDDETEALQHELNHHDDGFCSALGHQKTATLASLEVTGRSFDFNHDEQDTGGMKFPTKHTLRVTDTDTRQSGGSVEYFPPKRKGGPVHVNKLSTDMAVGGAGSALMNEIENRHPGSPVKFIGETGRDKNTPSHTNGSHGEPTDWDTWHRGVEYDGIHRGFAAKLAPEHASVINNPGSSKDEHLTALHKAIPEGPNLGMHWTTNGQVAKNFAHSGVMDPRTAIPVVLHGQGPARKDIETRPDQLFRNGVFPFDHGVEKEVPMRRGRQVKVTGISWKPDADHPDADRNGWLHHTYPEGEEKQHTAAISGHDWCTWRREARCTFPGDSTAVSLAIPQDRGPCPWETPWQQQVCPISEPGPMALMQAKGAKQPVIQLPLRVVSSAQTAALEAPMSNSHFTFTPGDHNRDHTLELHHEDKQLGHIKWSPRDGHLSYIETHHEHRRQGIGSTLWSKADQISDQQGTPRPSHSVFWTGNGSSLRENRKSVDVSHIPTTVSKGKGEGASSVREHMINDHGFDTSAKMIHEMPEEDVHDWHEKYKQFDPCGFQRQGKTSGLNAATARLVGQMREKLGSGSANTNTPHPLVYEASAQLDLYHRTTPEAAAAIYQDKHMHAKENTGETYWSTHKGDGPDNHTSGYGSGPVHVRVPEHLAELDDEFPDGEEHYRVHKDSLAPHHFVED